MMYGDPQQQVGDFHRGPPMRQPSASSTNVQPDYIHSNAPPLPPTPYEAHGDSFAAKTMNADSFAAKRMRKIVHRRAVDYTSTVVRYMQMRMSQRDARDRTVLQPTPAAAIDGLTSS